MVSKDVPLKCPQSEKQEKNWFSSSAFPLQNIIMCVRYMCMDREVCLIHDWNVFKTFIYFIFLLYKFVLLSLLGYIKRMFQVHKENKLCHKIFYGHSFFLLFISTEKETWKNIALFLAKFTDTHFAGFCAKIACTRMQ